MPMPPVPSAANFPPSTPLNAFFAWNEARRRRDRRYRIACDILALLSELGDDAAAQKAYAAGFGAAAPAIVGALDGLVDSLAASRGAADPVRHAAVFAAFEALAEAVDLEALAARPPRLQPAPARRRPRQILIVKLGALGDFVQALAAVPAIRRRHASDRLTLLTTAPYAGFAAQTGLFDRVLVDRRPRWFDIAGWLALGRVLRRCRFDRVYDLQTSDRSSAYAWLLRRGPTPEWSGIAWHCSHPHANPERDRLHTLDRQAEQLLMAGIHPVPLADWLPPVAAAPVAGIDAPFALLIAGSSVGHTGKRWPAERYGEFAVGLRARGLLPVIVGVAGEEAVARTIRGRCPAAVDLVGRTDIATLAALARRAALTVGNDTGATHVAAAGGNPVVVLFSRASVPELCAPRGARVRVLTRPDLADLAVDEVMAAACAALAPTLAAAPPE